MMQESKKLFYRIEENNTLKRVVNNVSFDGSVNSKILLENQLKRLGFTDVIVDYSDINSASNGFVIKSGKSDGVFIKKDGIIDSGQELTLYFVYQLLYALGVGAMVRAALDSDGALVIYTKDVKFSLNSGIRADISKSKHNTPSTIEKTLDAKLLLENIKNAFGLWDLSYNKNCFLMQTFTDSNFGAKNRYNYTAPEQHIKPKIFDFNLPLRIVSENNGRRVKFKEGDFANIKLDNMGGFIKKHERAEKEKSPVNYIPHYTFRRSIKDYAKLHGLSIKDSDIAKIFSCDIKDGLDIESYKKVVRQSIDEVFKSIDNTKFSLLKNDDFVSGLPLNGIDIQYVANYLKCDVDRIKHDEGIKRIVNSINRYVELNKEEGFRKVMIENLKSQVYIEGANDAFYENIVMLKSYYDSFVKSCFNDVTKPIYNDATNAACNNRVQKFKLSTVNEIDEEPTELRSNKQNTQSQKTKLQKDTNTNFSYSVNRDGRLSNRYQSQDNISNTNRQPRRYERTVQLNEQNDVPLNNTTRKKHNNKVGDNDFCINLNKEKPKYLLQDNSNQLRRYERTVQLNEQNDVPLNNATRKKHNNIISVNVVNCSTDMKDEALKPKFSFNPTGESFHRTAVVHPDGDNANERRRFTIKNLFQCPNLISR